MTFEILGIDHVVLRVADTERAIAFYEGVLGAKVERRPKGRRGQVLTIIIFGRARRRRR